MVMANTTWLELLEYARWSPSPHNIQPWKVKILSDSEAEVYYVPSRLLPDTDPTGRFTVAGFGMFIECIAIAAHAKGLELTENYNGDLLDHTKREPTFFAKLTLASANVSDNLNPELIKQRRTSRLPYDNRPVNEMILRNLEVVAKEFGHTFTGRSDPEFVRWTMLLNRDTLFYDMADPKSRNEVGQWLRFTRDQAHQKHDGLWAYCMRMPSLLMYFFFKHEWFFELPLIKQIVQMYYLKSMEGTRTVAWLSGPFQTSHEWFKAGRMLMRLWLTMSKNGVQLHPFGSIITNERAHARLREKLNADESKEVLWLIMRLGYSHLPPRSLRLPLSEILIQ
jgi:hypothetical protein